MHLKMSSANGGHLVQGRWANTIFNPSSYGTYIPGYLGFVGSAVWVLIHGCRNKMKDISKCISINKIQFPKELNVSTARRHLKISW